MVLEAIHTALLNVDTNYCKLSKIDYNYPELAKIIEEEKYLERPFAYEFYHELRKLMERGIIDFGGPVIQAEVDKRYQHCFEKGKIPDFIIHVPDTSTNLAVVEFKLASNLEGIENDLKKLVYFKQSLNYKYLIEVFIGNGDSLDRVRQKICGLYNSNGEEIIILEFNIDSSHVNECSIKYQIDNSNPL